MDKHTVTVEQYMTTLNELIEVGRFKGWLPATPAGQMMMVVGKLEKMITAQKPKDTSFTVKPVTIGEIMKNTITANHIVLNDWEATFTCPTEKSQEEWDKYLEALCRQEGHLLQYGKHLGDAVNLGHFIRKVINARKTGTKLVGSELTQFERVFCAYDGKRST